MNNMLMPALQTIMWMRSYFLKEYKPEYFKYRNYDIDNIIYFRKEDQTIGTMTFLITDNNELNIVIKHNDKEYCTLYGTLYGEDESKNPRRMDDDTAKLIVDNKDYIKYCVNAILDRYDYFAYKDAHK